MMRVWWSKLVKAFGGRRRLADELREEIDAHLEFEIQEHISMGMTPAQAQEAARREFGNSMLVQEQARESWMFYVLETILQDLRYGLRLLVRSPALATVAVLSLALGIGANTALFGVVNAVMLRALPVSHPEQLVLLSWTSKAWPERFVETVEGSVDTDKTTGQMKSISLSHDTYQYLCRNNSVFSAAIAFSLNDERVNVGLGGGAQDAMMQAVSGDYFQGLGVPAIVGRALQPADDRVRAPLAVVVSSGFWLRRLGGDRSVAGKQIVINGKPATIVGVAARQFFGVDPGRSPDLYVPLSFQVELHRRVYEEDLLGPKVWWLTIVGRLRPGMSEEQAGTELKTLFHQSLREDNVSAAPDPNTPALELSPANRGLSGLREEFSTSLLLMMAMVALVLLIACANVAGLLLARATSRQREISVRLSLGAPRLRIVRQLLTESVLLGVLGGAAGLVFARWVRSLLAALLAGAPSQPITLSVQPDTRVFAFTAVISVFSGILFGLAPALRARRMDVYSALRQNASVPGTASRRFLSGKVLVAAQVALCLLLMIGAGLLVRTLWHLQQVDLGFNRDHLLLFEVQPGLNGYKATRLATYYQDLQQRIGAIPGVKSVGISQRGPVGDGWSQGRVVIPGYTPPGKGVPFYRHWVSHTYFETLEIPLVLGRILGPGDLSSSPRVVVVNQRFVRDYLHGDNPIGRKFDAGSLKAEIVGVVGDTKYSSLRTEAPPTAYLSYLQYSPDYPASMTFEVRTKVDPATVVVALQGKASALDKDIPLIQIRTETEVISQALFLERTFALLSGSFGLLALLLACVGLYGTISYMVSRRTSEIGIRMALGASRATILAMVLRESLLIVLAGIAAGMPLAWVGTRLLESQLFGLSPHDPSTILLATAAIFAVTILAGFLPARRASRVDPVVALRCE
jgi:predicted permease